jgi:hypothetical protein
MKLSIYVTLSISALLLALPTGVFAQEAHGWSFSQRFQGSSNSSGLVLKSDSSVGYTFNDYWHAYAGFPVYFVRDSATGVDFMKGFGNAYIGGDLSDGRSGQGIQYRQRDRGLDKHYFQIVEFGHAVRECGYCKHSFGYIVFRTSIQLRRNGDAL